MRSWLAQRSGHSRRRIDTCRRAAPCFTAHPTRLRLAFHREKGPSRKGGRRLGCTRINPSDGDPGASCAEDFNPRLSLHTAPWPQRHKYLRGSGLVNRPGAQAGAAVLPRTASWRASVSRRHAHLGSRLPDRATRRCRVGKGRNAKQCLLFFLAALSTPSRSRKVGSACLACGSDGAHAGIEKAACISQMGDGMTGIADSPISLEMPGGAERDAAWLLLSPRTTLKQ